MAEQTIAINVRAERSNSYETTHVTIMSGELRSLAAKLAGTVDNRDGYGSTTADPADRMAVANRIARDTARLIDEGFTAIFSNAWGGWRITVRYQKYETAPDGTVTYCDGRIELGDDPQRIQLALPTFNRITRPKYKGGYRALPKSPEALIAMFPKSVRIDYDDRAMDWLVRPSGHLNTP